MNCLNLNKESVYGYSYLTERFLEKPFFLGVNGIEGDSVEEGKPWRLSFNPSNCKIYDSTNLDDLVILLLHIRHCIYFIDRSCNNIDMFDMVQDVIVKIMDRIIVEMDLKAVFDLDKTMDVFNLIRLLTDMLQRVYSILRFQTFIHKARIAHTKIDDFFMELIRSRNIFPETSEFKTHHHLHLLLISAASCLNYRMRDIYRIIEHNDLKSTSTEIVTKSDEIKFLSFSRLNQSEDPYFKFPIVEVRVFEDVFSIHAYSLNPAPNFDKVRSEILEEPSDVKLFEEYNQNSIIDEQNFNNYHNLEKMIGDSIQSSTLIDIENFRKISRYFVKHFWERRSKRNENNECILFKPEETMFIFQFTIRALNYMKMIPKVHPEVEQLLHDNLKEFGTILNSLRFLEIDVAITLKNCAILSETLKDLIMDPSIQNLMKGMPALIMLVTTRITTTEARCKSRTTFLSLLVNRRYPNFSLTTVKPIVNADKIYKIRKSKWRNVITDTTSPFYNQDECPVCYNKQQRDDSCFLICKHSFCLPCIELVVAQNEIPRCPVCRNLFFEYLPSEKLVDIRQALL